MSIATASALSNRAGSDRALGTDHAAAVGSIPVTCARHPLDVEEDEDDGSSADVSRRRRSRGGYLHPHQVSIDSTSTSEAADNIGSGAFPSAHAATDELESMVLDRVSRMVIDEPMGLGGDDGESDIIPSSRVRPPGHRRGTPPRPTHLSFHAASSGFGGGGGGSGSGSGSKASFFSARNLRDLPPNPSSLSSSNGGDDCPSATYTSPASSASSLDDILGVPPPPPPQLLARPQNVTPEKVSSRKKTMGRGAATAEDADEMQAQTPTASNTTLEVTRPALRRFRVLPHPPAASARTTSAGSSSSGGGVDSSVARPKLRRQKRTSSSEGADDAAAAAVLPHQQTPIATNSARTPPRSSARNSSDDKSTMLGGLLPKLTPPLFVTVPNKSFLQTPPNPLLSNPLLTPVESVSIDGTSVRIGSNDNNAASAGTGGGGRKRRMLRKGHVRRNQSSLDGMMGDIFAPVLSSDDLGASTDNFGASSASASSSAAAASAAAGCKSPFPNPFGFVDRRQGGRSPVPPPSSQSTRQDQSQSSQQQQHTSSSSAKSSSVRPRAPTRCSSPIPFAQAGLSQGAGGPGSSSKFHKSPLYSHHRPVQSTTASASNSSSALYDDRLARLAAKDGRTSARADGPSSSSARRSPKLSSSEATAQFVPRFRSAPLPFVANIVPTPQRRYGKGGRGAAVRGGGLRMRKTTQQAGGPTTTTSSSSLHHLHHNHSHHPSSASASVAGRGGAKSMVSERAPSSAAGPDPAFPSASAAMGGAAAAALDELDRSSPIMMPVLSPEGVGE